MEKGELDDCVRLAVHRKPSCRPLIELRLNNQKESGFVGLGKAMTWDRQNNTVVNVIGIGLKFQLYHLLASSIMGIVICSLGCWLNTK